MQACRLKPDPLTESSDVVKWFSITSLQKRFYTVLCLKNLNDFRMSKKTQANKRYKYVH